MVGGEAWMGQSGPRRALNFPCCRKDQFLTRIRSAAAAAARRVLYGDLQPMHRPGNNARRGADSSSAV